MFSFFLYNDRATLRGVSVFRRTFIYVYMYVHIYTYIYIYIYTVALHCFKPSKLLGYGFVLCEEFKIVYKIAVGLPMAVYRQTLNWE